MPRLWPFSVRTNSQVEVFQTWERHKNLLHMHIRGVLSENALLANLKTFPQLKGVAEFAAGGKQP